MKKRLISQKQRDAIKTVRESFIDGLTKEQVDTYIDNNVTDLASAKAYLKKLSKIVLYILKQTNLQ